MARRTCSASATGVRRSSGSAADVGVEQAELVLGPRVAHGHADHEAVALRLGQRVGAVHLHRVLRGHDDEGRRQRVGGAVHGHLLLLHGLQQRGLGLGGGPVDLVADDDVGEHGPGPELEVAALLVPDAHAGDVARQQVGGELDAADRAVDAAGEGLGQQRLADPGHVLHEQVALGQERDQREVDHLVLADHHLPDRLAHGRGRGRRLGQRGRLPLHRRHGAPPSPLTGPRTGPGPAGDGRTSARAGTRGGCSRRPDGRVRAPGPSTSLHRVPRSGCRCSPGSAVVGIAAGQRPEARAQGFEPWRRSVGLTHRRRPVVHVADQQELQIRSSRWSGGPTGWSKVE